MAFSQTRTEFEVASIRPSAQPVQQVNVGLTIDGAQVRATYMSLKDLIGMAYDVKFNQIVGPDFVGSARFDIAAKLPDGASPSQVPEMLRNLLADRFQMKLHRETREFPVYGLEIAKSGLRIKELPADSDADKEPVVAVAATGGGGGATVNFGKGSYLTFANNRLEARKLNMVALADTLARFVDRPVVDMTGLKGNYDVLLDFSPEDFAAMQIRSAIAAGVVLPPQALRVLDVSTGDSLHNALEKAGLRLEARRAPLEVLVIDQAQRLPTEN